MENLRIMAGHVVRLSSHFKKIQKPRRIGVCSLYLNADRNERSGSSMTASGKKGMGLILERHVWGENKMNQTEKKV